MRTTIEITDEHRARLLALAARRGETGFSRIVQEAIERYLAEMDPQTDRLARALAAIGSVESDDADGLEQSVRQARSSWR